MYFCCNPAPFPDCLSSDGIYLFHTCSAAQASTGTSRPWQGSRSSGLDRSSWAGIIGAVRLESKKAGQNSHCFAGTADVWLAELMYSAWSAMVVNAGGRRTLGSSLSSSRFIRLGPISSLVGPECADSDLKEYDTTTSRHHRTLHKCRTVQSIKLG